MEYYILLCRSITRAQRMERLLRRGGLRCAVQRAPRALAGEGCAYGLRLPLAQLPAALQLLEGEGLLPEGIYARQGERYRQVPLP